MDNCTFLTNTNMEKTLVSVLLTGKFQQQSDIFTTSLVPLSCLSLFDRKEECYQDFSPFGLYVQDITGLRISFFSYWFLLAWSYVLYLLSTPDTDEPENIYLYSFRILSWCCVNELWCSCKERDGAFCGLGFVCVFRKVDTIKIRFIRTGHGILLRQKIHSYLSLLNLGHLNVWYLVTCSCNSI